MTRVFNAKDLSFEQRQSPIAEFAWHTSPKLAELVKAQHLQFDIRSLDPGKYSYPYHFHRNAEEMFVILSGEVTLRTPDDFVLLQQGDVVFFEMGPSGAHQLHNHSDQPCIFLDIRTTVGLDVCEYPDSGKVNILPYQEIYETKDRVDYYLGEEQVSSRWPDSIRRNGQSRTNG